jgi:hypothetical protein
MLWRREAEEQFKNGALAIGGGRVFCIDSVTATGGGNSERRGEPLPRLPAKILALEGRSGRILWSKVVVHPHRTYGEEGWTALRACDDWLAWCEPLDLLLTGRQNQAVAMAAADGKELWRAPLGGAPWIVRGATFVDQEGRMFDARSGKPIGGRPPRLDHGGCNYMVGNDRMLFLRDQSVTLIDLENRTKNVLFAVRSGCSNSLVAADGLLSAPNFAVGCICNYPIQTSFAMVRMPEVGRWMAKNPARQAIHPAPTGEGLSTKD